MSSDPIQDLLADHGVSPHVLRDPLLNRREFISLLGGGIAVLMMVPGGIAEGQVEPRPGDPRPGDDRIGGWVHIGEDGKVTVFVGKVELGQNARTSLSMVAAEELCIAPDDIDLVMADTRLTPFDIGTFGSRTTPYTVPPLRNAAAAARELLVGLAAEQLGVDRAVLTVADHQVTDPGSGRSLGFGELTRGRDLVEVVPAAVPVIPPAEWRVLGKPGAKVDALSVVTGQKRFASDLKRPGMLHGKVLRPPAVRAVLKALDSAAAEAMDGVIVHRDGDFVAVVAPSDTLAQRALGALRAEWDTQPIVPPDRIFEHLRRTARPADRGGTQQGSVADGMAASETTLEQTYTVAYIAHSAIEPRSAIAEWNDGSLLVWTATQSPFGVRTSLAEEFRIPQERVRVIAPDTGNGFGGKTPGQAAHEAARLAKVVGRPVRVAWSREEEQTWPHFRPAGVIDIRSGVADGKLLAWEYHNYNSGPAALGTPYEVPNQLVQFHPCDSPLSQGAYRGLAAPANIWARETHMDELAHAVGIDPLEFRRQNLKDDRLRTVLDAAAGRFGWGASEAPAHYGYGIACGIDKGGYTATCADVYVDPATRQVRVERIVTAFECGAILNPLQIENQIIGAAAMAIGPALFEALEYDDQRILNASYAGYRLPRLSDTPHTEAVLVDRRDLPSAGAGETPFAGVAPAIGNAIFAATGVRIRALPMAPNGVPE